MTEDKPNVQTQRNMNKTTINLEIKTLQSWYPGRVRIYL